MCAIVKICSLWKLINDLLKSASYKVFLLFIRSNPCLLLAIFTEKCWSYLLPLVSFQIFSKLYYDDGYQSLRFGLSTVLYNQIFFLILVCDAFHHHIINWNVRLI